MGTKEARSARRDEKHINYILQRINFHNEAHQLNEMETVSLKDIILQGHFKIFIWFELICTSRAIEFVAVYMSILYYFFLITYCTFQYPCGRSKKKKIHCQSPIVSKSHCVFFRTSDGLFVQEENVSLNIIIILSNWND